MTDARHFTTTQVAKHLGLHTKAVLGFIRSGELIAIDIKPTGGKRSTYRIPHESLERFLAGRTTGRSTSTPAPVRRKAKPSTRQWV